MEASGNVTVVGRPTTHAQVPAQAEETLWGQLRAFLPQGRTLPDHIWRQRHAIVVWFVFGHAIGLTVFGLVQGWGPAYALAEGFLIFALALVASWNKLGRAFRSATAALGAVTSSAVLVQFSGGYIEAHFHYFVVVALIALYQDWIPFLLAIFYVAFDHGLIGSLAPEWVYNHPDAIAHPWLWALVHAVLVLAECAILIVLWKANEQSRAETDLVLRSAGEGILGLDLEGNVTFANPAAASMLGKSLPEVQGRPLQRLLPDATGSGADIVGLFKSGRVHAGSGQTTLQSNGTELAVDWTVSPVQERGVLVGNVLTLMDATHRRRAEHEHQKRMQQVSELERLKEMDRFKTLFINTAAHELHTPLTPLRLHVYALKEGHRGELNPEQSAAVDVLDRNVERMSRLVEDVLNAARLQADRMTLALRPLDLAVLGHDAVDSFQESARNAGIALDAKLTPQVIVEADAKRLMQVLYNLLDNAIKFTPRGGQIRMEVLRAGGGAQIRIADSGIGLRPDQIEKLFQPFAQGHDPMEETKVGTGLGLYISRGIVELHGGRISCRSDGPGRGSTFTVVLPLAESHKVADEAVPAPN